MRVLPTIYGPKDNRRSRPDDVPANAVLWLGPCGQNCERENHCDNHPVAFDDAFLLYGPRFAGISN